MKPIYRNFIITFLISVGIGCGATYLIASSQNGYVAGYIVLPLFLFFGVTSLILFIVGLICLASKSNVAPWLLLSAFLLPTSFISSAVIAKHFELGAYRQEPMIAFSEGVNTVIVFKEGTTDDQINDFWNKTLSSEREDGRGYESLPGIRTMIRLQPRSGREAMAFGFFPNSTEEQQQFVFSKVKSSPVVYRLLENEPLEEQSATPSPKIKTGETKTIKTIN